MISDNKIGIRSQTETHFVQSRLFFKFLAVCILLSVFLFGDSSLASVIVNQTSFNVSTNQLSGASLTGQQLGNGLVGVVSSYTFYAIRNSSGSGGTVFHANFFSGTDINCIGGQIAIDSNHSVPTVLSAVVGLKVAYTVVLSTPISLSPSLYYCIGFTTDASSILLGGVTTNQYAPGDCARVIDGVGAGVCNTAVDLQFSLDGQNILDFSQTFNQTPIDNSITPSTNVTLSFDYNAVPTDYIKYWNISLFDNLTPLSVSLASGTISFQGLTSSGIHHIDQVVNLISGHNYRLRTYLSTSTGLAFYGAPVANFSVVTVPVGFSPFSPIGSSSAFSLSGASAFCDSKFPTDGLINLTNGLCKVLGFLIIPSNDSLRQFGDIPSQISQRFPFSYVTGIFTTFENFDQTVSTSLPFITLASFSGTLVPASASNIVVFSATMLHTWVPDSLYLIYYLGMIAVLYFFLVLYLIRRIPQFFA